MIFDQNGNVKCKRIATRKRPTESGTIIYKKKAMCSYVRPEIALNPIMLKSLGLEIAYA